MNEALHAQVDRYIHTGFNVMMYEPYIALAEKLCQVAPGEHELQEGLSILEESIAAAAGGKQYV
ncbi:4-aminobutyrate aminotransferase-like enzyme [Caldalkalibacillus uzonensis]|uniref:4-aminobutyrate aminotransferase-like enzyme n=1 Tax=Caldalkalibacillus uzonensis TaxID=353224 RepID=A0ABU0CQ16_9BACI|nr:4-aminobutyrate aminotransferase-like enzyme [Caldalkalibacillus uzonensis]